MLAQYFTCGAARREGEAHEPISRDELSKFQAREFFLLSKLCWLVTVVTAGLGLIACYSSNFTFALPSVPIHWIVGSYGLAVFLVYTFRRDFFILSLSNAVATIAGFLTAAVLLAYGAAHFSYSMSFDLKDPLLASTDELFGLDWIRQLKWLHKHQTIAQILGYAYGSIIPQAICATIILSLFGQFRRLQTFILAHQISLWVCVGVSVMIPALGEYSYLKINAASEFEWLPSTATSYVADVINLRSGVPVIPLADFKGVITFPSFHASLALLFLWSFWRIGFFRWAALIFNGAMIAAIPTFGGHYFIDVAAGLLVGVASIWAAKETVKRVQRRLVSASPRDAR